MNFNELRVGMRIAADETLRKEFKKDWDIDNTARFTGTIIEMSAAEFKIQWDFREVGDAPNYFKRGYTIEHILVADPIDVLIDALENQ